MSYKIVRFFRDINVVSEDRETGLSLEEAQDHCTREDTQEHDANGEIVWFDGYTREEEDD